jgi:hypothetical protein
MRRRLTEPVDSGRGAGEFLAFLLVAALSACAFLFVGSAKSPPIARVVSMEDALPLDDRTASVSSASQEGVRVSAVPVPTPRPE